MNSNRPFSVWMVDKNDGESQKIAAYRTREDAEKFVARNNDLVMYDLVIVSL